MKNGYVTVLGSKVRLEPAMTLFDLVKSKLQVFTWLSARLTALVTSVAASFSVKARVSLS